MTTRITAIISRNDADDAAVSIEKRAAGASASREIERVNEKETVARHPIDAEVWFPQQAHVAAPIASWPAIKLGWTTVQVR